MTFQTVIEYATRGRGTWLLSREIHARVAEAGIQTGLCHLFLHHTSASLILCENADPDVRDDLERFMGRLVPDGDPLFEHTAEGPDDMSAHIRTILSGPEMTLPVSQGRCNLGTWQGIYLWEHRTHPQHRRITVTVYGD